MAKKLKDLQDLSQDQLDEQVRLAAERGDLPPEEVDESAVKIDDILSSNDLDGGTVRLSRRGPSENSFSYVTKIKAAEFDIDFVKKVFGGGDYIGQTFRANGQMYKKFEFSIDGRFQGTIELPKGGQVQGSQPSADPVKLMQVMHEMNKDDKGNSAIMQQMMKSQGESSQQMMLMMQQASDRQMQMMTAMVTAMASNRPVPSSDGLSVKDLITLLPTLVPLFKGDKPPTTMLETIEALERMRGLVSSGTVSEAPEAPKTLVEQIIGALPHVATTVQALRGGPQPQPQLQRPAVSAQGKLPTPPREPLAGEGPVAANPASSPVATADDPRVQLLATLVNAARKNKDVGLYADLVNSELEDGDVPMFHQLLTSEGWFDSLFGNLPDKTTIRPWFEQLRTLLLESFAAENPAPTNGSPEPVIPAAAAPSGADSAGVQSGRDVSGAPQN